MKRHIQNSKGFLAIGAAVAIVATVFILMNAIRINMSIFLSTFNRNKAFYDAEVFIDKFGTELRNAYDLGQRLGPAAGPTPVYALPGALPFIRLNDLYFQTPRFCVDRSDTRFAGIGNSAICIDINAAAVQNVTLASRVLHQFKAFKYALLKTAAEALAAHHAHAQYKDSFRPNLVITPNIPRAYNLNDPIFISEYQNYNCTIPPAPGSFAKRCVTFRFCTKFTGNCAVNEMVHQTVVLSNVPRTDVKD